MESIIIVFHVVAAIAIIGLVLIQHGKGADMGASFGSGGSQTMFGAVGSGNALTKSTTILATVFFLTSLGLGMIARDSANLGVAGDSSLVGNIEQVNADLTAEAAAALADLPVVIDGDIPVVVGDASVEVTLPEDDSVLVEDSIPVVEDSIPVVETQE